MGEFISYADNNNSIIDYIVLRSDEFTIEEITVRQAIVGFTNIFPSLRNLKLRIETWDENTINLSSGERAAAQFILRVRNGFQEWRCGEFNVVEALDLWDAKHREAFLQRATDPWWA